jgi:hypothetical protein
MIDLAQAAQGIRGLEQGVIEQRPATGAGSDETRSVPLAWSWG